MRNEGDAESLATVVFSSGSTGVPKGVMLSHRNILANVDAIAQVFQLKHDDVMVGVLPFFHSFGFSVTLWLPLVAGFGAVFHPNPMDGKTIGEISERYHGTILVSTPTFYAGYVRKCTREQFARVALRARRRREAARADRGGLQGEVRDHAARGLRLHRDVAGGGGQRAGRGRPRRTPARLAGRHGRPSAARRRRQGRRSRRPAKGRSSARTDCCS